MEDRINLEQAGQETDRILDNLRKKGGKTYNWDKIRESIRNDLKSLTFWLHGAIREKDQAARDCDLAFILESFADPRRSQIHSIFEAYRYEEKVPKRRIFKLLKALEGDTSIKLTRMQEVYVEPIMLTRKAVTKAALPLLEAGKLGRQVYPNRTTSKYRMGEEKAPCVIGSALPDDIAEYLDIKYTGGSIRCGQNLVIIARKDEDWFVTAQKLHDYGSLDELRDLLTKAL